MIQKKELYKFHLLLLWFYATLQCWSASKIHNGNLRSGGQDEIHLELKHPDPTQTNKPQNWLLQSTEIHQIQAPLEITLLSPSFGSKSCCTVRRKSPQSSQGIWWELHWILNDLRWAAFETIKTTFYVFSKLSTHSAATAEACLFTQEKYLKSK